MTARKWRRSKVDGAVHAFLHPLPDGGTPNAEAACGHTPPKHQLGRGDQGPRCLACTLIVATRHDETVGSDSADIIDIDELRQRRGHR